MNEIRNLLTESEPLLLFLVIGLGYMLGQIRIKGFSLGISGVLFAGLFFGGWLPEGAKPLKIAPEIKEVGLILFVYVVGLSSGPGFFASFKKRGLHFNAIAVTALVLGAAFALIIGKYYLGLSGGLISGVFCGGLTNTPALAAVTELAKKVSLENVSMEPTVGYSIAYPIGVIGGLLIFQFFYKIFGGKRDEHHQQHKENSSQDLSTQSFIIKNPELFEKAIGDIQIQDKTHLLISRVKHKEVVKIANKYTVLHEGDIVLVVGNKSDIDDAEKFFGEVTKENIQLHSDKIEYRRVLISKKELAGKTIGELELERKFGATITRLRRADIEMVPKTDTIIELGDRLRVVMPTENVQDVVKFFGDSVRGISELDYTAITLGITFGVLLGKIPIPMGGGHVVSLGFAGGPLIAGLILGNLGRTGPLVWSIPLESSQALSHIGILFFLAGVGVSAGSNFFASFNSTGLNMVALGIMTTVFTLIIALAGLRLFGKGNAKQCLGATSGIQTQPATLACAYQLSKSTEVYIAYATTYPVAMIGKIILAQLIFILAQQQFF